VAAHVSLNKLKRKKKKGEKKKKKKKKAKPQKQKNRPPKNLANSKHTNSYNCYKPTRVHSDTAFALVPMVKIAVGEKTKQNKKKKPNKIPSDPLAHAAAEVVVPQQLPAAPGALAATAVR
jgi:hypothetical protein